MERLPVLAVPCRTVHTVKPPRVAFVPLSALMVMRPVRSSVASKPCAYATGAMLGLATGELGLTLSDGSSSAWGGGQPSRANAVSSDSIAARARIQRGALIILALLVLFMVLYENRGLYYTEENARAQGRTTLAAASFLYPIGAARRRSSRSRRLGESGKNEEGMKPVRVNRPGFIPFKSESSRRSPSS